jgi:hypothetical protein
MRRWIAVIPMMIALLLSASQALAADKATLADWQARIPVLVVIVIAVLLVDLAVIVFVTVRARSNGRGDSVEMKGV